MKESKTKIGLICSFLFHFMPKHKIQICNELFTLLKRYGGLLDMQNVDLVKFILFFGKENNEIYRKACLLAKRRYKKLFHYPKLRL